MGPGYAPPPQGYAPPPQQFQPYPPQEPAYPPYPPQDQFQPPPYPQGYADDRGGYANGNPPPMDRFQAQDNFQPQFQQFQPHPPQYQPPPQFQFQEESPRYPANPPLPPQPPTDYAEAARTRQQAYAPVQDQDDAPEAPPSPYKQQNQPPPFQSQQMPPPLPPTPQGQRDWNYPPQQQQERWQQPQQQQEQWQQPQQPQYGPPPGYAPQNMGPPPDQRHFQRDPSPRFQDRRQDRHDRHHNKQHRPPPPSYVCHNCNQPGHWKQHCPLFANDNERYGVRQEEPFQQRYGPGQDRQWTPGPPPPGSKPQDPRRNGGAPHAMPPEAIERSDFAMKNENRGQPPLPDGPAPPLPYGNDGYGQQQQQQQQQHPAGQQVWKCESCVKSFVIESQYQAHMGTHVTCSDCDFSASKRVVTAHYQSAHGQYAGEGLKEIDVEGQKFMVLVGNSAEDIAKWREERRKKWLAMSRQPKPSTATPASAPAAGKRKLSVSSEEDLEEGEIEEDEEARAQIALKNALAAPEPTVSQHGGAGAQEPPAKKQRKTQLCKWFARGHCRFDDAHCKYSHDRSAFGCRAMMFKGSCSKGMYCLFSHDTAVMSGQRERSQKASKERATEQQWRGEQKSLLRKLLAKDVRVEQHKMLQIVHFLVANDFFCAPDGEKSGDGGGKESAVKIEVLKSEETSSAVTAQASETIKSMSDDIVMEEASSDVPAEQASTEEPSSGAPSQTMEPTKVVAAEEKVVPVVKASAQESQGVSKSPVMEESEATVSLRDGEAKVVVATSEEESVKDASSSAGSPQCNAMPAITEDVIAAVPTKDTELVEAARGSDEEPAMEVPGSSLVGTVEASTSEANEAS
ncbi:unnamed protein product [Phytophthora lilii]|uniref:Unnamed protein product n=1 Tax=Phytophthora lilii TaxID=2077276 RepID=A0A9W6XEL2_9STRA|nr:unnamed protein product [Phytophthora lilii]